MVLADVSRYQKPERGYIRTFPCYQKPEVHADVPRYQKRKAFQPEFGAYRGLAQVLKSPSNPQNCRKKGKIPEKGTSIFCAKPWYAPNPGSKEILPKTGTRAHSPKPPFFETAPLFPRFDVQNKRPRKHLRDQHPWKLK